MKLQEAERLRIKYKYRELILKGKLILPHQDAIRLIGPDCAYHLYKTVNRKPTSNKSQRKPITK